MVCEFLIGRFRSVLFVSCFKVRRFVILLFRAVIDQLRLLGRFFCSFLFLSLARIKKCLPPSFDKNPLTIAISFAVLEQSRVILSQAGRTRYIVICFGQQNSSVCSFIQFTIHIIFRTAVLQKLFDIMFSYPNSAISNTELAFLSRLKMASKSVIS